MIKKRGKLIYAKNPEAKRRKMYLKILYRDECRLVTEIKGALFAPKYFLGWNNQLLKHYTYTFIAYSVKTFLW